VRWSDPLNLPHDWALIVLEKPIGRETGYLGWRALAPDAETARMMEEEAFSLAGYPRDRAHAISLDAECRLVQFLRIKQDLPLLLGHRCAIIGGDSGAPIARRTQDGLEVVALNSAADLQLPTGERINSAVPLATFADEIAALLADTDPAGTGTPSAQGRAGRMPAR
jgi:V8-like Glu-specific endopeptidase